MELKEGKVLHVMSYKDFEKLKENSRVVIEDLRHTRVECSKVGSKRTTNSMVHDMIKLGNKGGTAVIVNHSSSIKYFKQHLYYNKDSYYIDINDQVGYTWEWWMFKELVEEEIRVKLELE